MQRRPARIRTARRELVERAFEVSDEALAFGLVGTRLARRRHHAGPELAHDLFPLRGVRRDVVDVDPVEEETREQCHGALGFFAVTLHARRIEERARRGRRRARRLRERRPAARGRDDQPDGSATQRRECAHSLPNARHQTDWAVTNPAVVAGRRNHGKGARGARPRLNPPPRPPAAARRSPGARPENRTRSYPRCAADRECRPSGRTRAARRGRGNH